MNKSWFFLRCFATIGILVCLSATSLGDEPTTVVAEAVRTLIVDKCLACHAGEKPKGDLDLTRRRSALSGGKGGAAIVPGQPAESLLFEKVEAGEMPPKSPLSTEAVAAFKSWISAGAPYASEPLAPRKAGRDWWSLRPISRPSVPAIASPWIRNPIDAFVLAKLRENGLEPGPQADRAALIRRLSFDLVGLPPTPEEIDAFLNDHRLDAYEHLVDKLLASPRYGERWGRHWLDIVRFGESHGYEMNQPRVNAWPYRDYVIRAFNNDLPFPQFVLEQLAADTLTNADFLTQAATGFIVGGAHDQVGNATPEGMLQQRADDLDDMITATSSAFLGLTINCARCHDHKFDPITQRDYYGLQAVFAGVNHVDREVAAAKSLAETAEAKQVASELSRVDQEVDANEPLANPDSDLPSRAAVRAVRNVERFAPVPSSSVRLTILATGDGHEPCLDELEAWTAGPSPRNVALASQGATATASSEYADANIHKIRHLNDGQVGNNHSWISQSSGRGWVRIDWPTHMSIDKVVWGRDREEKFRDRVATDYYLEMLMDSGQWRVVASSLDRLKAKQTAEETKIDSSRKDLLKRQAELRTRLAELRVARKVYAGTFSQPERTHVLRRGDPTQKAEPVLPGSPAAISPALSLSAESREAERRVALARWIGDAANPLPARVMVNRAWHYHFGQGIVATPSDFGFNGVPPSHPELLDWLASEYRSNGFRLKPIHRLILLSSSYRQSSQANTKALTVDKNDRLLWRFPPRRLEAEPIRDAILAVSGRLDGRMGGAGYSPWEPNTNYVMVYTPKIFFGPPEYRRMVYQFKPRSRQDPTFGVFDCPDAALVAPRRTVSTTALQALNLLNSRFTLDLSTHFGDRLKTEVGEDPIKQTERAFRLAFGRVPNSKEVAAATSLIRVHGLPALCRSLYNANEFVYIP